MEGGDHISHEQNCVSLQPAVEGWWRCAVMVLKCSLVWFLLKLGFQLLSRCRVGSSVGAAALLSTAMAAYAFSFSSRWPIVALKPS